MDVSNPEWWKQQVEALLSAPLLCLPPAVVLAIIVWWFRSKLLEATISGLREQTEALKGQLQIAADKGALELKRLDIFAGQINDLKAEVAKTGNDALAARVTELEAGFAELVVASNAVRSAVGIVDGVSARGVAGAVTIQIDEDS